MPLFNIKAGLSEKVDHHNNNSCSFTVCFWGAEFLSAGSQQWKTYAAGKL